MLSLVPTSGLQKPAFSHSELLGKREWSRIPGRGGRVCEGRSNAPRWNAGLLPVFPNNGLDSTAFTEEGSGECSP